MNKFTLRGQDNVNTQWQMYCLVHNIEKLRNSLHYDIKAQHHTKNQPETT